VEIICLEQNDHGSFLIVTLWKKIELCPELARKKRLLENLQLMFQLSLISGRRGGVHFDLNSRRDSPISLRYRSVVPSGHSLGRGSRYRVYGAFCFVVRHATLLPQIKKSPRLIQRDQLPEGGLLLT